jgi:hypothetical protein
MTFRERPVSGPERSGNKLGPCTKPPCYFQKGLASPCFSKGGSDALNGNNPFVHFENGYLRKSAGNTLSFEEKT